MDHYKLCISYPPGKPVTHEQLSCYLRQLAKDLSRETPCITWEHPTDPDKADIFFTHGLSEGKSQIVLNQLCWKGCLHYTMCYTRDDNIIFQALESNGDQDNPNHLIHLYLKVKSAFYPSHNRSDDLQNTIYMFGD